MTAKEAQMEGAWRSLGQTQYPPPFQHLPCKLGELPDTDRDHFG